MLDLQIVSITSYHYDWEPPLNSEMGPGRLGLGQISGSDLVIVMAILGSILTKILHLARFCKGSEQKRGSKTAKNRPASGRLAGLWAGRPADWPAGAQFDLLFGANPL